MDDFLAPGKQILQNNLNENKGTIKKVAISAAALGLAGFVTYMLLRKDTKARYLDACDKVIKTDGKSCGTMMRIHAELVTARNQLLLKQPDLTEREFNKNILGLKPDEQNRVSVAKKLCH